MLGQVVFRPSTCEIAVGERARRLEPRVMHVLTTLARKRGRVVSRFELIEQCWGGRSVGDDAINRCIQAIRKLGAEHSGFTILTVPRVGYRLDAMPADPVAGNVTASARLSERRQLTLLSCELVSAGPGILDPEAWYAAVLPWQAMAIAIATEAGAYIEGEPGHRLTAWFGHPRAQEGAARNAVRAALLIAERTPQPEAGFVQAARAGVHAGLMVTTEPVAGRIELFGEVRAVAEQARSQATAGSVIVTRAIADQLPNAFELTPLASGQADEPLFAVREAKEGGARRLVEAQFAGRDAELAQIGARWRQTLAGAGQFVLVEGEPGIGKSRLVREFVSRIAQPHRQIFCRGEEQFAEQPFHTAQQIVRSALGLQSRARSADAARDLSAALAASANLNDEARSLLREMLGLTVDTDLALQLLPPERRRQMLLKTLVEWVAALAGRQPLILFVDDLQWVDSSTFEMLETLARQCVDRRLLLIATSRVPSRIDWKRRPHPRRIALGELGEAEMRELVGSLVEIQEVAEPTIRAALARADGVPLFGEALGRLLSSDTTETEVPATLLDTLAARLDRIGDARKAAFAASVIGREFSVELLGTLLGGAGEPLGGQIDQLVEAGLVVQSGQAGDGQFRFRHALIRDAAYGALTTKQRRDLHRLVAGVMTAQGADPALLAHHWQQAGETARAMACARLAGEKALRAHAFAEARHYLKLASDLVQQLPPTPERDAQERDLAGLYAVVLFQSLGASSQELHSVTATSTALAEQTADLGVLAIARSHAFGAAMFTGDWEQAGLLAEQLAALAQGDYPGADPETLVLARSMAHYARGTIAHQSGQLAAATSHFQAWEALNEAPSAAQTPILAMAVGYGALLAFQIGDLAEMHRRRARLAVIGDSAENPFLRAGAWALDGLLSVMRRDPSQAKESSERAILLAGDGEFSFFGDFARATNGWAIALGGAPDAGAEEILRGIGNLAERGTKTGEPQNFTFLAEVQSLAGQKMAAEASFLRALEVSPTELIFRPLTLVCRAEHYARFGDVAAASRDLAEAAALAEKFGAHSYALRAVTGLARHTPSGNHFRRLSEVVAHFAVEDDLPELREARALLARWP